MTRNQSSRCGQESCGRSLAATQCAQVVVISGSANQDLVWFNEFLTQLKPFESQPDIEYVTEASVQELLEKVSHLPRGTIVLPIVYSRDRAGNNYVPRDVNTMLAEVRHGPDKFCDF